MLQNKHNNVVAAPISSEETEEEVLHDAIEGLEEVFPSSVALEKTGEAQPKEPMELYKVPETPVHFC